MNTPSYVFYEKKFKETAEAVKAALGNEIPICFSIKANPFLLNCLPEVMEKVEVCSPGELEICIKLQIPPEKIIYSGVMKDKVDVARAVDYNVAIMTAESPLHVELENEACMKKNVRKKVILRLTSGNQFGMSADCIKDIVKNRNSFEGLEIIGIHFYSGTQKKLRSIDKDLKKLDELLVSLKDEYSFEPELVEYGPGLTVDYFSTEMDANDSNALNEASVKLKEFAKKYPLGIEMGRFFASACGVFISQVKDIKKNKGASYVICDGGIHHLKYYGQTMAMLIPPMTSAESIDDIISMDGNISPVENKEELSEGENDYCICGSLCTVADVLVRSVHMSTLKIGDYLAFGKCGAYSVTEGSSLFLSRDLPDVYIKRESGELELIRESKASYVLNV